jgi:hypothetical protein
MAPGMRPSTHAEVSELTNRIQQLEKRQRWVTAALALAVLVAVAWPIALSALSLLRTPEEKPLTLPTGSAGHPESTAQTQTPPPAPAPDSAPAPAPVPASEQKDTSAENEQHAP